jgi:chromosome segregation protein
MLAVRHPRRGLRHAYILSGAVFLKSLTLKGFKSFADPTTLELEPGVTVVVGPNGSGKSNVVDAVAWVLGAQGPRTLRSSKMDDVIFAGTSRRAALGRAEVTLTIDNSARKLPIDFAEVTVTRTLFRTGESEYAINGVPCRLLDVQELFSDTGVGRQQHVIVGQGQLDTILTARPEDRRMVVEEAAGVLKYRRRRERAERRLEASEANLVRLQDLLREVRRQLKPLERQAESARRHGDLAAELRALRLYLSGRELAELARRREAGLALGSRLASDDSRLREELRVLDEVVTAGEHSLAQVRTMDVRPALARVETLLERARGVANVLAEKKRSADAALESTIDAGLVASLESEAASLALSLAETERAAAALSPDWEELAEVETRLAAEERAMADAFPAAHAPGPHVPGPQVPGPQVPGPRVSGPGDDDGIEAPSEAAGPAASEAAARARARYAERREALGLVREAVARSGERIAALERRRSEVAAELARAEQARSVLGGERERWASDQLALAAAESAANSAAAAAEAALREALAGRHAAAARAEALRLALDEVRARAGVERLAGADGVIGTLLDVVEVDQGYEKAFEAAVEEALGAVVVDGVTAARDALGRLRSAGSGGAVLVAGVKGDGARGGDGGDGGGGAALGQAGVELVRDHIRSRRPSVDLLLDRLLAGVVCCTGSFSDACDLAVAWSGAVVVTLDGDRFAPSGWRVGGGRVGATRAALEEATSTEEAARAKEAAATGEARSARSLLEQARAASAAGARALDRHGAELARCEQAAEEMAHQLARLDADVLGASAESARLSAESELAELAVATQVSSLAALEAAETAYLARSERERDARRAVDERARAVASLRSDLEVRAAGLEERRALLTARLADVERRLAGHQAARAEAAGRRQAIEATATAVVRLGGVVAHGLALLQAERERLMIEEARQSESYREMSERLAQARQERSRLETELSSVRERAQRLEIEQTEVRLRQESAVQLLANELEVEPEVALGSPLPELPATVAPAARARELERELRLLGPVNPLALEELNALEERSRFLEAQLDDVRGARRELGRVIRAVDAEITSVFEAAFSDVAGHFEALFQTLFPGGTGQLSLTDPENLLETGIEIEARPAGRNVRRLSLLSGGERSLVALAFLFSVFRSRPSPFYLMDEVEAALDDVNLHRFLDLVDEFRGEAQLIIVSHQKRTMEAADALYGITMQPGGSSKVVSERVARPA